MNAEQLVRRKWRLLTATMDERARRLWAGAEGDGLGWDRCGGTCNGADDQHGRSVAQECARTPEVDRLLQRYQVLALHGPPRHPYYYGQLERQNREHRAWESTLDAATQDELAEAAFAMRTALNALALVHRSARHPFLRSLDLSDSASIKEPGLSATEKA